MTLPSGQELCLIARPVRGALVVPMNAVGVVVAEIFEEVQSLNLEEVRENVAGALVEHLRKLDVPSEFWQEIYSLMDGLYGEREALLDAMGLFNYVLDNFVERGLIGAKTALKLRVFIEYFQDTLFPRNEDCVREPSLVAFRTFFILAYGRD